MTISLPRDANRVTVIGGTSSTDGVTPVSIYVDPTTHRIKADVTGIIPVAGSDTWVQYNRGGVLGADSNLAFDYTNKILKVGGGTPTYTVGTNNIFNTTKSYAGYLAVNLQNLSNGTASSTDFIINADNATDTTNWLDIGIASSLNTDPLYTIAGANQAYIYNQSESLAIGTATAGKVIKFFTGGTLAANEGARLDAGTFSVGLNATTLGKLKLYGNTSGSVTIQPNAVAGTGIVLTLPATTGTIALSTQPLSQFATTTSLQLAGVISDETGSGSLVFGTTPTLATPVINGLPTGTGVASTTTASTLVARDVNANIFGNNLIEGFTSTATAGGVTTLTVASTEIQTFTGVSNQTLVLPNATTLTTGHSFRILNTSTGNITVQTNGGATIWTMAATTDLYLICTDNSTAAGTWETHYIATGVSTGKRLTVANSLSFIGADAQIINFGANNITLTTSGATSLTLPSSGTVTALGNTTTGSGSIVLATSPTLATPTLGVASATSINKVAITAPATSATLTIADGKTLTASNTLTFTGTDASSVAFGTGGTVLYSGGALGTPASGTLTNCTGLPATGVTNTAVTLSDIQTLTGAKTFNDGKLILAGATSGTLTLKATAVAGTNTITFPASTGTVALTSDIPVKATGAELDTGTDDAKFATAKALKDSHNVPSVAPSTSGNVMTSNGTDWVSSAPAGGGAWTLVANVSITGSAATTLSSGTFTAYKFIKIEIFVPSGASGVYNAALQFNADSTANHHSWRQFNNASSISNATDTSIHLTASTNLATTATLYSKVSFGNFTSNSKSTTIESSAQDTTSFSTGQFFYGIGGYYSSGVQVTQVTLIDTTGGGVTFPVGTQMVITGHN